MKKKRGPKSIRPYDELTEQQMKYVYNTLSEKEKRAYAAVEALKLPRGGKSYISRLFGCSRPTIDHGIENIRNPDTLPENRSRKKGGGRKRAIDTIPNIDIVFFEVLKNYTAGDPMDERIIWTNMNLKEIAEKMRGKGVDISDKIVKQLLKKHGYKKRKAMKNRRIGSCDNRNEQFEKIAGLRSQYENDGNPIISVDTKKKELLGNLYRDGKLYSTDIIEVYDHDFPYLAEGNVIPHAIYDVTKNSAWVNIGISKDTSEFACDSIKTWWLNQGRFHYPTATSVLMIADGGGSNSSRHYIFKEDLQKLVDEIGIEIRIAHYPPYTSKWNPVEHRLFPHITRSMSGVILKSYQIVKELIEKTTTKKGLKVKANIIEKTYKTGRKYADNFKKEMRIIFDDYLGKWNYKAVPMQI